MFWKGRYTIFLKGSDWDNGYFDWEIEVYITSSLSWKWDKVNVKTSRGHVKTWFECLTPCDLAGSSLCINRMYLWHCFKPLGRTVNTRLTPHKRAIFQQLVLTCAVCNLVYSMHWHPSFTAAISFAIFAFTICTGCTYCGSTCFMANKCFCLNVPLLSRPRRILYFLGCCQENVMYRNWDTSI